MPMTSEIQPPCNTVTSLIQPYFFWVRRKTAIHFLVKKPSLIRSPVNMAKFFGPFVTLLKGFHCNENRLMQTLHTPLYQS